jgi:predicted nucleic acid-binding protein
MSETPTRSFIDTHILIYAEISDEPAKRKMALTAIKSLYETANAVLSTQVLQEYCNVALKKLKLTPGHIRSQLDFYETFEIITITPHMIRLGLDLHQTRNLAFFDAMVIASAQTAGCSAVLSENMNAGEMINGVKIVNPFSALPNIL